MRIFGRNKIAAPPPVAREQYEVTRGLAQDKGIIESLREVHERDAVALGYYIHPVDRASGSAGKNHLMLPRVREDIPMYVTPHDLGDPVPSTPLVTDELAYLEEQCGGQDEEQKKDPIQ